MMYSPRPWPALAAGILAVFAGSTQAAEPTVRITETREIQTSVGPIQSADITRYRDRWICVLQTKAGLQIIGSQDGKTWQPLSTVNSPEHVLPLRDARLTATTDGRLMLSAVAPGIPCGGSSLSWFSYDGVKWKKPKPSAESNYLVSNVFWHVGVAYNFQCGSICGSATTIRIGASSDHGETFSSRYQETFSQMWPGKAALVFSQDNGFCLMQTSSGNKPGATVGVSRAPFTYWTWKPLPTPLKYPNAVRTKNGTILVAAGIPDEADRIQTMLCRLDPDTLQLKPAAAIPTGRSGFVGLARHEQDVYLTWPAHTDSRSVVHFAKVIIDSGEGHNDQ